VRNGECRDGRNQPARAFHQINSEHEQQMVNAEQDMFDAKLQIKSLPPTRRGAADEKEGADGVSRVTA
jgi:hypothetical protein